MFALAREVTNYAASTLKRKKRELERNLTELVGSPSACPVAEELRGKMARTTPKLLTFLDFPGEVLCGADRAEYVGPFRALIMRRA